MVFTATGGRISGGQIEASITTIVSAISYIKAGTVRPLAVSSLTRSPMFPNLPTISEATGNSGYEMYTWYGVVARTGTPKPIIDRLNAAMNQALDHPDMQKVFNVIGVEPTGGTPGEFGKLIYTDVAKYGRVVRAAHLQIK